VLLDCSENQFV